MVEHLHPSGAGRLLDLCPKKVRYGLDNRTPSTPAQINGTATHSLTLGGPRVNRIQQESWSKTAKAVLAKDESVGETAVLDKDYPEVEHLAHRWKKAIKNKFGANPDEFTCEKTIIWDSSHGVVCEGTPDLVIPVENKLVVVDLKTCANINKFGRSIADYHYDLQLVAYMEALSLQSGRNVEHLFLVGETVAPHCTRFVKMNEEAIAIGEAKWATACAIWKECQDTGHWPDHDDAVHEPKPWEFERWMR